MNTVDPHARPNVLSAFSSCLLALGDVTFGAGVERILEDAMRTLQPLVRFDRAWWGQVAGGRADARNWLQGHIGLSPRFGEEWNRIAAHDKFGQGSMHQLGRVIRASEGDQPVPEDILGADLAAGSDRVTVELPGSGQLFFVSLYRGLGTPPFGDDEVALFAEFAAHLLQGWRRRLAAIQARLAAPSWEAFAVADADGRLLYLGRRMAAELKRAFPAWNGWVLPP